MPGKHITTITELKVFVQDLIDGNDPYVSDRIKVRELTNSYIDGNSTKRIVEFLGL